VVRHNYMVYGDKRSSPGSNAELPGSDDDDGPGVAFLPEPRTAEPRYTLISVDHHLIEPAELFEGRMFAELADETPQTVELPGRPQGWPVEGEAQRSPGLNAVAGRSCRNGDPTLCASTRWDPAASASKTACGTWTSLEFMPRFAFPHSSPASAEVT
jgi:hypothetical protein